MKSAFRKFSHTPVGDRGAASAPAPCVDAPARRSSGLNPVRLLTESLIDTLKLCNPEFKMVEKIPRRVLTHPSEPHPSCVDDNAEHNLICRVHDELFDPVGGERYRIIDLLGTGTFGQVLRCRRVGASDSVAVKIIKNKSAYRTQSQLEVRVLRLLNHKFDPENKANIVRMLETFEFKGHTCLVFELLDYSLYDLLTQNQYRGLPLFVIQSFTKQILSALVLLQEAGVIHCDLKPENIMLSMVPEQESASFIPKSMDGLYERPVSAMKNTPSPTAGSAAADGCPGSPRPASVPRGHNVSQSLKVIDFGSVCFESKTMFHYIQSRFYRSPEVLVGFPYNGAIDMWSLGCVCCEMFLGLPIFPGVSQHNQLTRIIEMLGMPSDALLENGNLAGKYFKKTSSKSSPKNTAGATSAPTPMQTADSAAARAGEPLSRTQSYERLQAMSSIRSEPSGKYRLKTAAEYAKDTNTKVPVVKKYLKHDKFDDVILKYPYPHIPPGSYKDREGNPVSVEYIMGREQKKRECFLHFLHGLLTLNPWERWTAKQAFEHPFISNELFADRKHWAPAVDPKINERVFAVISQVQARDAKSQTAKRSSPPVAVPAPPPPAPSTQASVGAAVSKSPHSSLNSYTTTPVHDKGGEASRSNSRQSVDSFPTMHIVPTPSSVHGRAEDLPVGAVPIAGGARPPPPPGVPPPRTPSSDQYHTPTGSWEQRSPGQPLPPNVRPPLPRGPPPRQGHGAAGVMASASFPPPVSAGGLMAAWAPPPPPPPAAPPSPYCTPPQHGHHYNMPQSFFAKVHLDPGDYSPRTEHAMYMQQGEAFPEVLLPGQAHRERKPRALTQINMYDRNLDMFNMQHLPPGAAVHGSGGLRRESFAGSSSSYGGPVLSDFDLAILRTPTDQSRVFQSKHDTVGMPDYRTYHNSYMGVRPPPPQAPPPYPLIPHAEPPQYYPSSNYGVAQSYDSYRPMVMQNAMQNYCAQEQALPIGQQPFAPPLPPGPPPAYAYARHSMSPVEPINHSFSGMSIGRGYAQQPFHAVPGGPLPSAPPPPPYPPPPAAASPLGPAPAHQKSGAGSTSAEESSANDQLSSFEEKERGSEDVNEQASQGSPSRPKAENDDSDPFFAFDDV